GAIACFLAAEAPGTRVLATELDPGALAWAEVNAGRHGVELLAGDLDQPLPAELAGRLDVLCANVPYVPSGAIATLPGDVRDHEPRLSLDGGPDGLDVFRRVAGRAAHWLAPGGRLYAEIGEDQAEAAAALLTAAGLAEVAIHQDLVGRDRIVEGTRPRAPPTPGPTRGPIRLPTTRGSSRCPTTRSAGRACSRWAARSSPGAGWSCCPPTPSTGSAATRSTPRPSTPCSRPSSAAATCPCRCWCTPGARPSAWSTRSPTRPRR